MSSHCVSELIKIMCGTRFTFQFTNNVESSKSEAPKSEQWTMERERTRFSLQAREFGREGRKINGGNGFQTLDMLRYLGWKECSKVMKNWRHTALNLNTSRLAKTNTVSYCVLHSLTQPFETYNSRWKPCNFRHGFHSSYFSAAKTNWTATQPLLLLNPPDNHIAYL